VEDVQDLLTIIERTGLGKKKFPNRSDSLDITLLKSLLPEAVEWAGAWMSDYHKEFVQQMNPKLDEQLKALERLKQKQYQQLELFVSNGKQPEKLRQSRKEKKQREIDRVFEEYRTWIKETMTAEDSPYLKVVAVLTG